MHTICASSTYPNIFWSCCKACARVYTAQGITCRHLSCFGITCTTSGFLMPCRRGNPKISYTAQGYFALWAKLVCAKHTRTRTRPKAQSGAASLRPTRPKALLPLGAASLRPVTRPKAQYTSAASYTYTAQGPFLHTIVAQVSFRNLSRRKTTSVSVRLRLPQRKCR